SLTGQADATAVWTTPVSDGDATHWESEDVGPAKGDVLALAAEVRGEIEKKYGWKVVDDAGGTAHWKVTDAMDGSRWSAETAVSETAKGSGQYRIRFKIKRDTGGSDVSARSK